MKTRILFVTMTLAYGGTENALADLLARLDLTKVEPIILCFGLDLYSRRINEKLRLPIRIQNGLKAEGFCAYWRLFKQFDPNVIMFVNGIFGLFPWYAYLAARMSGATRVVAIEQLIADPVPREVEVHGLFDLLRRWGGWQARHMFSLRMPGMLSHRTICVSDAVRERLISEYHYSRGKMLTIRNGVDLKKFGTRTSHSQSLRRDLNISVDDSVIVCIARLDKPKRIDILLEALSLVCGEYRACKCVIAGDGPSRQELVKLSGQLGLDSTVSFVGHQEDVRPYLDMADIFVLSSEKEGLPLALLEAMAHGLPCVVSHVAGNSEVVLDGYNGLLVPPGSAEQLAAAIKCLLGNKQERDRMGRNARQKVQEFDVDTLMAQLKTVLLG